MYVITYLDVTHCGRLLLDANKSLTRSTLFSIEFLVFVRLLLIQLLIIYSFTVWIGKSIAHFTKPKYYINRETISKIHLDHRQGHSSTLNQGNALSSIVAQKNLAKFKKKKQKIFHWKLHFNFKIEYFRFVTFNEKKKNNNAHSSWIVIKMIG